MKEEDILKLEKELQTQDNLATQDPLYVVYDWERFWSNDTEWDSFMWVCEDGGEWTEEELVKELNSLGEDFPYEEGGYFNDAFESLVKAKGYTKRYFKEVRRFISAFFTRKSAQDFIDTNHYHWNKPHIYVNSLWRNYEMQDIRNYFLNYKEEKNEKIN